MSIKLITVLDSISALSVSGVTVKDLNEVTEAWQIRGAVLYPDISNLMTFNPPVRQSFGTAGRERLDVSYTLNYRFLYAPIGSGRGVKDIYSGMMTKISAILDALNVMDAPTGSIDMTAQIVQGNPVVKDPAGNDFWGCDFSISVLEYNEV